LQRDLKKQLQPFVMHAIPWASCRGRSWSFGRATNVWSPSMATATSRRAPAADALIEERDALCAELIALEREGLPRVTRAAAIEARLKQIADERKESFKVTLSNGDYVQVAPPVAAEFKGNVPVVPGRLSNRRSTSS
jgi:hypothetical protein